jgi:hypothetical protein
VSASDELAQQGAQWNRQQFEDFLRLPGSVKALHGSKVCLVKLFNKLIGEPQWIHVRGQDGKMKWLNSGWKVSPGASMAGITLD